MFYQCNKGHVQIIQFSVNRWIILPAQVPQKELSMGSLNPQLQLLCQAQLQVSFPLLCNILILLIIYYCYYYYLCRFLLNTTLTFVLNLIIFAICCGSQKSSKLMFSRFTEVLTVAMATSELGACSGEILLRGIILYWHRCSLRVLV